MERSKIGSAMNFQDLNRNFELRPIKSAERHAQAIAKLTRLTMKEMEGQVLTVDEIDYMSTLGVLIENYEAQMVRDQADSSPADALQYLLEVNGLRQSDLKHLVEKTHLSEFLSKKTGARQLSKTEARLLGERFGVDPMLFRQKVLPQAPSPTLGVAEANQVEIYKTASSGKTRKSAVQSSIRSAGRKAVGKSTAEQAGKPRKAPGEKSKVRKGITNT